MNTTCLPLAPADFSSCLRLRDTESHKGTFGSTGIVGGAPGMGGALLLAARSALWLGSGRVFAAFLDENAPAIDVYTPELMLRTPAVLFQPSMLAMLTALAIGPGLGTSEQALQVLDGALDMAAIPLVIDADGLNLLATNTSLLRKLQSRHAPVILTPHPAEAARLLGTTVKSVQADRELACAQLVHQTRAYVVLKGSASLIGEPGTETLYRNPTGNPGMASAGMGDVLTGIVAAFLAQGNAPAEALRAAVYIHGLAADELVSRGIGPVGLTASEVGLAARGVLNRLVRETNDSTIPPKP